MDVYVIGGGWLEDGKSYKGSEKIEALRSFWEKLFREGGGHLKGYGQPMLLTDIE